MVKIALYFDSSSESGKTAMAYAAYEGTMRLKPIVLNKIRGTVEDPEYEGYNQYMFKLETLHKGLQGVNDYIKKEKLTKYNETVEITCYSQHTMINNMVGDRTANDNYMGKLEEILNLVDDMGSKGVLVNISYVKGDKNYAKKFAQELMTKIRLEPKQVTLKNNATSVKEAMNKTTDIEESNVIQFEQFKIM